MKNINKPSTSIKNWALDDQPLIKMTTLGPAYLSNAELFAILIRTGTRNSSAVDLSKELLRLGKNNLHELARIGLKDLQKINGIGEMKAVVIAAALELSRRKQHEIHLTKTVIKSSVDVADYFKATFQDLNYEVFAVLLLNNANKIIHVEIISKGGITSTVADPRIILKIALEHSATNIVLCHNHPSGNLQPSKADEDITFKIKNAAALLEIKVIDHLIVSNEGYYSFMDEGKL